MAHYLELADISFVYIEETIPVWQGLSCGFQPNTINLLLGPSGCGKSSLLYLIDGLIPHSLEGTLTGEILLAGEPILGLEPRQLAHRIGLVFQDPDTQFCAFYVEDELAFGMENLLVPPEEMDARIDRALVLVGLRGFRKRAVTTLSGGQKQKLAIASALVMDAELLLLDEPSALLDASSRVEIMALLQRLVQEEHKTILLVEHNLDEVLPFVGHVVVLNRDGALALQGSAHDVFARLAYDEAFAALPVCLPEPLLLLREWLHDNPSAAQQDFCREQIAIHREGAFSVPYREIAELLREDNTLQYSQQINQKKTLTSFESPTVVETRALGFHYPPRREDCAPPVCVLNDVSCTVREGEWVAIAGANGAGKSTLLHLLFRVFTPTSGDIFIDGASISSMSRQTLYRRMGLLFQNPEWQFVTNRVEDELLFSLRSSALTKEEQSASIDRLLRQFHLEPYRARSPFLLSQGEKRRLSVACMLLTGQRVLFFDEPTYGQDSETARELLSLLESLRKDGVTIVTVTHDMGLVCEHADRMLLLNGGTVAFDGAPSQLFFNEITQFWRVDLPPVLRFCDALREHLPTFPRLLARSGCLAALKDLSGQEVRDAEL